LSRGEECSSQKPGFLIRFYKAFTVSCLLGLGKKDILTDEKKEVSAMGLEWKAAEDLEDLLYECKEVSASER
jgi:hypothetical protein